MTSARPVTDAPLLEHALLLHRISLATDFSEPCARALDFAMILARQFDASLNIVHVLMTPLIPAPPTASPALPLSATPTLNTEALRTQTPVIRAKLVELVRRCNDQAVTTTSHLVTNSDNLHQSIIDSAVTHRADVLVMGTHGRAGLRRIMSGSVAESVVRRCPIPVLLVPQAD
jgi:nucleotide-binding universal stress UspA family protein